MTFFRRSVSCRFISMGLIVSMVGMGLPLSAQAALTALQTIRHVTFRVDGQKRTGVTSGSPRARQVLQALKITDLRPPTPPKAPRPRCSD